MYTGACGAAGAAVVPSGVVAVGLGGDGWSAVEVGGGAGRRAAARRRNCRRQEHSQVLASNLPILPA